MTVLRFFAAFSFLFVLASSASAQSVDWKSLGKPLDDDTKSMRDRYVYSQAETTTDKNVGVEQPVLAPNDVSEWLSQRIPGLFALAPKDYDQKTVTNQPNFTPKGYGEYIGSLNSAQLPSVVKEKGFTVSAVVTDPPSVTAKGVRDDGDKTQATPQQKIVYVWQVDAPLNLNYKGPGLNNAKSYKILLKVELVRIPMTKDSNLVAINGWRLEEYKPTAILGPQTDSAAPPAQPAAQ